MPANRRDQSQTAYTLSFLTSQPVGSDLKQASPAAGTPAWIRTKDQKIKSLLLYQLSYGGVCETKK